MTSASPNFPNPCDKGSAWLVVFAVPVGTVVTRFYDPCYALFPKLSILRWKDQMRKNSPGDSFLAIATNKSPQKTRDCLIYQKRPWFNPVRFPDPPLKWHQSGNLTGGADFHLCITSFMSWKECQRKTRSPFCQRLIKDCHWYSSFEHN